MTVLRATPDTTTADQVPAGDLTAAHHGRTVTILGDDGSVIRGTLTGHALAGPGYTTLTIQIIGWPLPLALPHTAPVHVHHQENQ